MNLKKSKSQDKAVEVTLNSKEENSQHFCLDFVQEFGLSSIGCFIGLYATMLYCTGTVLPVNQNQCEAMLYCSFFLNVFNEVEDLVYSASSLHASVCHSTPSVSIRVVREYGMFR